jgi:large subunit ribosomal protein L21
MHYGSRIFGQIAQSVEQRTENPCVAGSIPVLANFYDNSYCFQFSNRIDYLFYVKRDFMNKQDKQSQKYAIIQTGGKQYRVAPGEYVNVELIDIEPKQTVKFDQVLFVADGSQTFLGAPSVENMFVYGEVIGVVKGKKVESLKYKASHNQCRRWGHRQKYTRVKITSIGA